MRFRLLEGPHLLLAAGAVALIGAAGCQPEQRPTAGSVKTIGSPSAGGSASVSAPASGSVSVSAPGPAASPVLSASPAASPRTGPAPAASPVTQPSKSDGIYTPTTNREIYQSISLDYQEIVKLTNQVNDGKPLPSAEILDIYENARIAKSGTNARPMRAFARGEARATEFPEAAAFYGDPTFLDTPVIDAINGTGTAASYTPAQRRQAIQKGLQRILYYWTLSYIAEAGSKLSAGTVDEAWAIYMGKETPDGKYPSSLSATAVSREQNFKRDGSLDVPLRQALSRAQQAAARKDQTGYDQAAREVKSRLNAIFYLSSARYLNEALVVAGAGQTENAKAQQMEGLSYYQSIQPTVATADRAADGLVVAYYNAAPESLTQAKRDEALAALNRAATALQLTPADLLTPAAYGG